MFFAPCAQGSNGLPRVQREANSDSARISQNPLPLLVAGQHARLRDACKPSRRVVRCELLRSGGKGLEVRRHARSSVTCFATRSACLRARRSLVRDIARNASQSARGLHRSVTPARRMERDARICRPDVPRFCSIHLLHGRVHFLSRAHRRSVDNGDHDHCCTLIPRGGIARRLRKSSYHRKFKRRSNWAAKSIGNCVDGVIRLRSHFRPAGFPVTRLASRLV